jgi:hypothetical protein
MNTQITALGLALTIIGVASAAAGLPKETAQRIDDASFPADSDSGFLGSFVLTTESVVSKANGENRKESSMVFRTVRTSPDAEETVLVRAIEEGEDVTEKRRERFEEAMERQDDDDRGDDEGEDGGFDLAFPDSENAHRIQIGQPALDGGVMVAEFAMALGHEDDEDASRGRVAWDAESLDPVWIEAEALDPKGPLKEFTLRMEYTRIDGTLWITRLQTQGLAKVLLMKRRFDVDMRLSDLTPATAADASLGR